MSTRTSMRGSTATTSIRKAPRSTRRPTSGTSDPGSSRPGGPGPPGRGSGAHTSLTVNRCRRVANRSAADRPPDGVTSRSTRPTPARRSPSSRSRARAAGDSTTTTTSPLSTRARHSVPDPASSDLTAVSPLTTAGTSRISTITTQPAPASPRRRRRAATTANVAVAVAARRWATPTSPSGRPEAHRATHCTHPSSIPVGACRTDEAGAPVTPASTPAVMPQAMISAAAGSARRLAGMVATGRPPTFAANRGPTATWADSTTASAGATTLGTGRCADRGRANTTMPAEAATDS